MRCSINRRVPVSRVFTLALIVVACLLLPACGGGGGGDGGGRPGTAPTIADLVFGPTAVYVGAGGGTQTVSGEFGFTDPDGDLASVQFEVLDENGVVIESQSTPVQGASGLTSGTILGAVEAGTSTAGNYAIRVSVTDARGLRSNALTATFRISEFPWVARLSMPLPRREFATAEVDGRIYVLGGGDTQAPVTPSPATTTVQVYDPVADRWTTAASMPVATRNHSAVVVAGKVYVVGGESNTAPALDTLQVFDPATGQWSLRASLPYALRGSAAAGAGGRLYVFGGDSLGFDTSYTLSYDVATNTWASHAPMLLAGRDMAAVTVDGRPLVLGGYSSSAIPDAGYLKAARQYDPATDAWTPRADMLMPRADLAVALLEETVYAAGGGNWSRALVDVHAYDVANDRWTGKTAMPTALAFPRAEVVNGKVYVFDTGITYEYTPGNDIM